jgi:hypothetical protein
MTSHIQCQGNRNGEDHILMGCVPQLFEYKYISTYSEMIQVGAKRIATLFSLPVNPQQKIQNFSGVVALGMKCILWHPTVEV